MKVVLLIVVMAMLTACASEPNIKNGPRVPADRILNSKLVDPANGPANLIVARWKDAWGSGTVDARVYLDGEHIANMGKGEVLNAHIAEGHHTVGVKLAGLDSVKAPIKTIDFNVASGGTESVEIFYAGTAFDIQPYR